MMKLETYKEEKRRELKRYEESKMYEILKLLFLSSILHYSPLEL